MTIMKAILICLIAIVALLAALCIVACRIAALMARAGGDLMGTEDTPAAGEIGADSDVEVASSSTSPPLEQPAARAKAR
jgi:hypothetical protein